MPARPLPIADDPVLRHERKLHRIAFGAVSLMTALVAGVILLS